jgi:hypothetical protein
MVTNLSVPEVVPDPPGQHLAPQEPSVHIIAPSVSPSHLTTDEEIHHGWLIKYYDTHSYDTFWCAYGTNEWSDAVSYVSYSTPYDHAHQVGIALEINWVGHFASHIINQAYKCTLVSFRMHTMPKKLGL